MRITLVSNEILGAHRNGGIGTATSHLALLFAHAGHAVRLHHTGPAPLDPGDPWALYYRMAGVEVAHRPEGANGLQHALLRESVAVFEALRDDPGDVIIFQDWLAPGHACMVAKRCGLAFADTTLAVIAHSSSAWTQQANRAFPGRAHDLVRAFMEQRACEMADLVIAPSAYLVDWMGQAGWTLPAATHVIPYFLGGPALLGKPGPQPRAQRSGPPDHIAFFGRLEERKGISLFLAALAAPPLQGRRFRLSFLGKPATHSAEGIRAAIAATRPDLLGGLDIHDTLTSGQAQDFLAAHDPLVVMPSLTDNSPCVVYEALQQGLRFVAAGTGGIPELIDPADNARCLAPPQPVALAERLAAALDAPDWPAPRAAFTTDAAGRQWLDWLAALATSKPAPARPAPEPTITVVVTHYERPALLAQALRALSVQSDADFRTVIVDDGSTGAGTQEALDGLAARFPELDITLVRQPNRYVGAARNTGIRQCTTSHVILMDDDNLAFPRLVETFRRAARVSGADIVTCQMQFFEDPAGEPDLALLAGGLRQGFPGGPPATGMLTNDFGDLAGIYRRDVFDRFGGFAELRGVTHEDWHLHLRTVLGGGRLESLPVPLFWYRVAPGSIIRTTSEYLNMRVIAEEIEARLPPALRPLVGLLIGACRG